MPQMTLGKSLGLSSAPPSPSKPTTPKKNSKLTPGVAAAKANGSQGKFGGKESSIKDDLEKLGLSRDYLETVHGESLEHGRKGNDEAKERPSDKEVKKGIKAAKELGQSETPQGKKEKNKTSNYAPTKDDVDMEDPDRAGVIKEVQDDIPDAEQQIKTGNASISQIKDQSPSHPVKHEQGTEVSGTQEGRGKKRAASPSEGGVAGYRGESGSDPKKRKNAYEQHGKVAHPINAAKVDRDPPLDQLVAIQEKLWGYKADKPALTDDAKPGTPIRGKAKDVQTIRIQPGGKGMAEVGKGVVYWMRMEDLRITDNRALALASDYARENDVPLIVLFTIVPGDYKAHDRSARSIDFRLRNLENIQAKLAKKNIPLHIYTHKGNRFKLPRYLVETLLPKLQVTHIFGNIEYEVDELRRDIEMVDLGAKAKQKIRATFVHDRLAVPPGTFKTGQGKPYGVFSPWQKKWQAFLEANPDYLYESPEPRENDQSARSHELYGNLFEDKIPSEVDGFKCLDRDLMSKIWPEGTENAIEVLNRFLYYPARKQDLGLVDPRTQGGDHPSSRTEQEDSDSEVEILEESPVKTPAKKGGAKAKGSATNDGTASQTRIRDYTSSRNSAAANTSSRLSPYLASGVISIRVVLNKVKKLLGNKLESGRDSGPGTWVMECAWRDFYNHVMAAFPRTSMGRPYLEKFSDVQWEVDEERLDAWKQGRTGFPIVDAAMRQCMYQGWMHNRPRMICASFLVKDLMLDWRLGERYFMESFVDGDLAANDGGWQCASTGTDPQPYFRIFNPFSQSETATPDGAYIRYWVPELASVPGNAIHDPHGKLSPKEFAKLNYPAPIVDHAKARARALARYKQPGYKPDEDEEE